MMISMQDVAEARRLITPYIHHTPLVHSTMLSKMCGAEFYMKCENLQKTGAFKVRGGMNNLQHLTPEERARGVVTASSGNHAQGVAYAAQMFHTHCTLCMQDWSSPAKIAACKGYQAEIKLIHGDSVDTLVEAERLRDECGYIYLHPFNSAWTIAGQGTIAFEILEDLAQVDTIVLPVAGGGLASGVGMVMKELYPHIKVYGVQAKNCAAMYESLKAGRLVKLEKCDTCCDGLAAMMVGDATLEMVGHYLDDVITLTEEEIREAVVTTLSYMKMLIEPSSATTVAAILGKKVPVKGNVVAIATGGNCSPQLLASILTEYQEKH